MSDERSARSRSSSTEEAGAGQRLRSRSRCSLSRSRPAVAPSGAAARPRQAQPPRARPPSWRRSTGATHRRSTRRTSYHGRQPLLATEARFSMELAGRLSNPDLIAALLSL